MTRITITRHDTDGTVIDGTAELVGPGSVRDFRDLDGYPLALPPGSSFELDLDDFGIQIGDR